MAGKGGKGRDGAGTIVLKRIEEGGHGHHGGAWKVAYADFVTAMMAFFLLMWLLNATSEEQRRGIADFFSPVNPLAQSTSGAGLPFAGRTPNSTADVISDSGAMNPSRSLAPSGPETGERDEQADSVDRSFGQGDGMVPGPGQPAASAPRPSPSDADGPAGETVTWPEHAQAGAPPTPPPQTTALTAVVVNEVVRWDVLSRL
jgi:chemotaxis protein MotB